MLRWAAGAMFAGVVCTLGIASGGDDAKYSIKDVMNQGHKNGLWKKVAQGKATADEKKKLVDLYTALTKDTPPKGDKEAWKKQTEAMLEAAKASLKDDKEGEAKLLKLVNCASCHKVFK
ncbi:hypothetical protein BH10PLA2_BH10PLA2_07230 [soil metagenome]